MGKYLATNICINLITSRRDDLRFKKIPELMQVSNKSKKTLDRRTFLKITGGTAAAAFAATAGYGILKQGFADRIDQRIAAMQMSVTNQQELPEAYADEDVKGCTTIVVGKNATADGSVLMSHNEDDGPWNCGTVHITPHKDHTSGTFYTSYFGAQIPNPPETYGYVWTGDPNVNGIPGDFYNGINEYQVTICENVATSKETWGPGWFSPSAGPPGPPPTPEPPQAARYKVIWTDFMHLVMQRCKTAREGCELIGWVVANYGGDITSTGDMHGIADANEAWILMKTPHHWCAKRCPDNGYLRMANRLPYATYDIGSKDLQSYALAQGWWNGIQPFSFMDAYGVASTQTATYNTYREQRVDMLLQPKLGSILPDDLKAICRDHYEGMTQAAYPSGPYFYEDSVHKCPHVNNPWRTICVDGWAGYDSTESSAVHHLRSNLPNSIGGLMWATLGCSCTGVYLPYYAGLQSAPSYTPPAPFTTGLDGSSTVPANSSLNYDPNSAWWTAKRLTYTIDNLYTAAEPHVRQILDVFEAQEGSDSEALEKLAAEYYNLGRTGEALKAIADFTNGTLLNAYDLLNHLTAYACAQTHGLYPSITPVTSCMVPPPAVT